MLAQKFENYYGKALTLNDENDWILDPFVGTDLPHLPLLCYGRVSFASLKEQYPKDSANIQF